MAKNPDSEKPQTPENVDSSLDLPQTSPKIGSIKDNIRKHTFQAVIANEGQIPKEFQRTDDLNAERSQEIADIKEAATKGREVVLEQKRIVSVLKDIVNDAIRTGKLKSIDLKAANVSEDTEREVMAALEELKPILDQPLSKIFDSDLDIESYQDELSEYLQENLKKSFQPATQSAVIRRIFDAEINQAVQAIDSSRKRPVLAHRVRGFGKDEASYEGLKQAITEKVSELEFDIRVSKDGTPFIHHNATLGNLADRPEALHALSDSELRLVKLANGERLSDLREFFEIVRTAGNQVTKINIDIKDFDEKMLDEILNLIREYKFEHRVQIVSWFPQALQYLYEKDPSLQYSLSYYPTMRGISSWLLNKMNSTYSPLHKKIPGMNWLASHIAKRRVQRANERNPESQSTASEQITDAMVVNPDAHWREIKDEGKKSGQSLVGKHTMAIGNAPVDNSEYPEMSKMFRVLQNGSVNIMALEELLPRKAFEIPIIGRLLKTMQQKRLRAITDFAKECEANGVKVNLFDLKDPSVIDAHFAHYEAHNTQAGVVYSSNPETIHRLRGSFNTYGVDKGSEDWTGQYREA